MFFAKSEKMGGGNLVLLQSRAVMQVAEGDIFSFMRERVARKGVTVKEIAQAAGMPDNSLSTFLNGHVQRINVETLAKLAPALDVPFEVLCRKAVGLPEPSGDVQGVLYSPRALAVAAKFELLTEAQQAAIEAILESL